MLPAPARSMRAILTFFALAFAWSWLIGFGAQYVTTDAPVLGTVLAMASGFGPSLAAIAVIAWFNNHSVLRDWFSQSLNWRVGWRWYAVAFCLPPTIMLLALIIHGALGGAIADSQAIGHVPLAIANFGLVLLVGGPLGEEFGWRGYALPALAARLNWRGASLLLGLIWGLWHLPLFFMPDTPHADAPLLLFLVSTVAQSVMFAWLFVNTRHSLVPALVMHTSLNAWFNIIPVLPSTGSLRPLALMAGIQGLVALVLLVAPDAKRAKRSTVWASQ